MSDIYTWSLTASENDDADAAINWAEFQDPDTVNNSARQMMTRVAEFRNDLLPKRTSTGSANAYVVSADGAPSALTRDFLIWFVCDKTNSAAATLQVDALPAKPLRAKSGISLTSGDMQASTIIGAYYRVATDEYLIVNSGHHANILAPVISTANNTGLKVGDVLLSLDATPKAGRLRLLESEQSVTKTDYPELNTWASAQGYPWGSTATTFNLPRAAGYFPRFAATTSTIDTGGARTAGSVQSDQNKTHTHTFTGVSHTHSVSGSTSTSSAHTHGVSGTSAAAGGHSHTYSDTTSAVSDHTHFISSASEATYSGQADLSSSTRLVRHWNAGTASRDYDLKGTGTAATVGLTSSDGGHSHSFSGTTSSVSSHSHSIALTTDAGGEHSHTFAVTSGAATAIGTIGTDGGEEVRCKNVAFHCDIVAVGASAYSLPTYTVSTLPASHSAGWMAFASNGRKNGEGAGLGTGVMVFSDGASWLAVDTGAGVSE